MKKRRSTRARRLVKLCGAWSVLVPAAHAAAAAHPSGAALHRTGHIGATSPMLAPVPRTSPLKLPSAANFGFLGRARPATPALPAATTAAKPPAPGFPLPAASKPPATALAPAGSVRPADASTEVTLDNTLVTGQSIPYANGTFTITPNLGRQAGGNLFYSFGAFSLATGQTASFTGTPITPVQDVFVRITGGQASTIDGTLACTYPNAGFVFMNPSGVTFAANASLNLQASFTLTTADYIGFADGLRFVATGAAPGGTLSPAAPTALGFLDAAPAGITVNGAALALQPGKSLLSVAGSVTLSGGSLSAPGGPVSVAAVGPAAQVPFSSTVVSPVPVATTAMGPIVLTGSATISSVGVTGGPVSVQCGSLSLSGGSSISGSTNGAGSAGQVTVIVSGPASMSGSSSAGIDSGIYSQSGAGANSATGDAGKIAVSADSLQVLEGAQIDTSTFGAGHGGNTTVNVSGQTVLSGTDAADRPSAIFANSYSAGVGGNAGSVNLTVGNLQVQRGAEIGSTTFGLGNGGAVTVKVSGPTLLSGADAPNSATGIYADSEPTGAGGNAGSVLVTAGGLRVLSGAAISSTTFGLGNGGNVIVRAAGLLVLSGVDVGNGDSGIYAGSSSSGSGGNAGDVTVAAADLQVLQGAQIDCFTLGAGAGGNTTVTVSGRTILSGTGATGANSGIYAGSASTGDGGNAGSITLGTDSLRVSGGAKIDSATFNSGAGGDVMVEVSGPAVLFGANARGSSSGIVADSESFGVGGDAGIITLAAGSLLVLDGAQITCSTFGDGNARGVSVNVSGPVVVSGVNNSGASSGVFAESLQGTGNAGSVTVAAASLRLTVGADVASSALLSHAGDVVLSSRGTLTLEGAMASVLSGGDGGDVSIRGARQLVVQQSVVTAQALGNGGQITLAAPTVAIGGSLINGLSGKMPVKVGIDGKLLLIADSQILTDRPQFFPSFDLSGSAAPLHSAAGVPAPLPDVCGLTLGGEVSSFVVTGRGGVAPAPEGWQPDLADPTTTDGPDWMRRLRRNTAGALIGLGRYSNNANQ